MLQTIIITIVIIGAVLFALWTMCGFLTPFFIRYGFNEDDPLDGYVVATTALGSLIRLSDGSLCWSKTKMEPDTKVLVTISSKPTDTSLKEDLDSKENCFMANRAVLDGKGLRVDVIRRITNDLVVCKDSYGLVLVECNIYDQASANKFDENLEMYLLVRSEGVRMIPLCDWCTVKTEKRIA